MNNFLVGKANFVLVTDLEEANEENSLKYFEGMDAYLTCFGTTRAKAGGNVNSFVSFSF